MAFVLCWTIFGLMATVQVYIRLQMIGRPEPFSRALAFGMTDMYLWGVVALAAFLVARQLSIDQYTWPRLLVLHVLIGIAVVIARTALEGYVQEWLGRSSPPLLERIALSFTPRFMTYLGFVGASYGFVYLVRHRERELKESQLREELARAQLGRLKMQLQPHFLFNALHSISSLMHRDIESADRMLARLAELLRLTIRTSDSQVVPLEQELDELRPYLEIEQIRFGDRLAVKIDVDDVQDALVPHMILQPLIENAIRHGISPLEDGGKVQLKAHREGDWLVLIVADNGVGFKDGIGSPGHGVGLGNTRTRLLHLYGRNQQLEVLPRNGRGSIVKIRIPLETDLSPGSLLSPLAEPRTAEMTV